MKDECEKIRKSCNVKDGEEEEEEKQHIHCEIFIKTNSLIVCYTNMCSFRCEILKALY